jgi:carboxymethylenebutenolidase
MSQYETLMARDGHTFNTYIAKPAGHARGAVVVLQEIFGLTPYICRRADHYAQLGYLAVAPALFDRIRRGLVLGYSPADFQQGAGYRGQISTAQALLDIAAAAAVCRHAGTVTVVGYCWGGRLAWAAASELPLQAAVCFYGSRIPEELPKIPRCPTLLHFGERDASIPPGDVERIHGAFPAGVFHRYAAGHGFDNEDRAQHYDAAASALARERTDAFLTQHMG